MALLEGSFSLSQGEELTCRVFLPQDRTGSDRPMRVVYGVMERGMGLPEEWRAAAGSQNLALILAELPPDPSPALLDRLEEELPSLGARLFRVDNDPNRTWSLGVGLGGYLALRSFYRHSKRYAGCLIGDPAPAPSGCPDLRQVLEDAMLEAVASGSTRMPGWLFPPRLFGPAGEGESLGRWMKERGIPVEVLTDPEGWRQALGEELELLPGDVPHAAAPCPAAGTGRPPAGGAGCRAGMGGTPPVLPRNLDLPIPPLGRVGCPYRGQASKPGKSGQ